ncbi:hypothetical protein EDD15DRAFT_2198366 [Pisolithus albus]|nr:hypothetical protein EDD15DRAFT_2198366 [Pisolithus albus]
MLKSPPVQMIKLLPHPVLWSQQHTLVSSTNILGHIVQCHGPGRAPGAVPGDPGFNSLQGHYLLGCLHKLMFHIMGLMENSLVQHEKGVSASSPAESYIKFQARSIREISAENKLETTQVTWGLDRVVLNWKRDQDLERVYKYSEKK